MAAIASLSAYGTDSSDSDEESKPRSEDFTLHLKPIESSTSSVVAKLNTAPAVASKVYSFICCPNPYYRPHLLAKLQSCLLGPVS